MIQQQLEIPLSPYAGLYDIVVPQDDIYRQLDRLVDFSFVYKEIGKNYSWKKGRFAEDPVRMFKYLLIKIIDKLSDRRVVANTLVNLSLKRFLRLRPEETNIIDASTLSKFRKLRFEDVDVLNVLIAKTLKIAKDNGLLKGNTILVDATHVTARAVRYDSKDYIIHRVNTLVRHLVKVHDWKVEDLPPRPEKDADTAAWIQAGKALVAYIKEQPALRSVSVVMNLYELLEEAMEDAEESSYLSMDRDAKVGHKSTEKPFFGSKVHMGVESETRLITAAHITSGDRPDDKYWGEVVEQSRKNGMEVKEVVGDKAYSSTENLEMSKKCKEENPAGEFTLYSRLHNNITYGIRKDDGFTFNKDANTVVCPNGHPAKSKRYKKKRRGRSAAWEYSFDINKCKECPLREKCFKAGSKKRTYSVRELSDLHREYIKFQKTDEFKEKMRQRYKIEAKNSDLKHNCNLERAESFGEHCLTMQTALSVFACNIKTILRLINAKK